MFPLDPPLIGSVYNTPGYQRGICDGLEMKLTVHYHLVGCRAVSLICSEVFLWLMLQIFYQPENFGIGGGIAPLPSWLRACWQPHSDCDQRRNS